MRRRKIQILGLTEVRMKGKGGFISDALILYHQAAKCVESRTFWRSTPDGQTKKRPIQYYSRCRLNAYHRPLGRRSRGDV